MEINIRVLGRHKVGIANRFCEDITQYNMFFLMDMAKTPKTHWLVKQEYQTIEIHQDPGIFTAGMFGLYRVRG